MENQFEYNEEEELRRERRKKRIAEMKRQKEKREQLHRNIKRYTMIGGGVLLAAIFIGTGVYLSQKSAEARGMDETMEQSNEEEMEEALEENLGELQGKTDDGVTESGQEERVEGSQPAEEQKSDRGQVTGRVENQVVQVGDVTFRAGYSAETTSDTIAVGDTDVLSSYAILINADSGTIVAQKNAKTIINPASMTKILTLLVAAEHIADLDDKFTMTLEITDYAYVNDCSSVGFLDGEIVTVRDLLYGTILPSGGDAAVALATYVAGSQEAFVDMMNDKLEELGLSETAHFTNCVGLYDEEHYCSVYDMAMILKAAAENDLCREVLSAHTYTTSATTEHPDGITISNWFLRRIEDKDTGGEVLCAKTGYVDQSGSCAASYGISDEGTPYICVTAQTYSSWRCIYDHVALYSLYTE